MLEGLTPLERCALLRRVNSKGNTALHMAVNRGADGAVAALLEGLSPAMHMALLLLSKDGSCGSVLGIAAYKGMLDVVAALLRPLSLADKKRMILQKQGEHNETVLDRARSRGHGEVVALFERYLQAEEPAAEDVSCEGYE
jgi:ankyrin repeat protein